MIIVFKNRDEQEEVMHLLDQKANESLRLRVQGILCYNVRHEDFDIVEPKDAKGFEVLDKSDLGIIPKMLGV